MIDLKPKPKMANADKVVKNTFKNNAGGNKKKIIITAIATDKIIGMVYNCLIFFNLFFD